MDRYLVCGECYLRTMPSASCIHNYSKYTFINKP